MKNSNLANTILEYRHFQNIHIFFKHKTAFEVETNVFVFSTSAKYLGCKKNLNFSGKRIIQIKTIKVEN